MKNSNVRQAAWSGQFYPSSAVVLRSMVRDLLDQAPTIEIEGRPIGLIAPHAGYEYSGKTAAAAYGQLLQYHYDTVVIVAPSHTEAIDGVSVFSGSCYGTPLGSIDVDHELAAEICSQSDCLHLSTIGHSEYKHRPEHSLEVHLPFLQEALNGPFRIVPMVFHDYSWRNCQALGKAIATATANRESVLLVASTDLYHGDSYEDCKQYDAATVQAILANDPEAFLQGVELSHYQACGAGPVAAVQVAANEKGPAKVTLVEQTSSADVTGMRGGWTVGYASLLITEQE